MTSIDWLYVALGTVVYLAGVAVTYGMARNASTLPETWKCWFWPLILILDTLGYILKGAFDGLDWIRLRLVAIGERWGARLNRGGAA